MTAATQSLKALVVDDSALYRKIVRDVLSTIPGVEVIGAASNGRLAVDQIASLKPDVVTLDLEMPELDGAGVLRELSARNESVLSIMVSAFTTRGAQATTTALGLGAFDFVLKPTSGSLEDSFAQLRAELAPKIDACRARVSRRGACTPTQAQPSNCTDPSTMSMAAAGVIGVGVSTGGPQALGRFLPKLPASLPCPLVIVQHMPPMFTKSLAEDLNTRCSLSVSEAQDGQPLRAGEVLIAPGGKQLRVERVAGGVVARVTDDPPERNCKPAVDYLFRSLAECYGHETVGVILTGMGDDGTLGAGAIKRAGGRILAQDSESCVVYGMPRAVAEAGHVDFVGPTDTLAAKLLELGQRRSR